ncbi:MAG: CPBP family intramembrane glutamic endopeptidase [Planctomycetota bacterium]
MPTDHPATATRRRLLIACGGEGLLVAIAAALAWGFGLTMWSDLAPAGRVAQAIGIGVVATGPMVLFLLWMLRSGWRPMASLREMVGKTVGRLLEGAPTWALLVLAVMAGVGEELLFRGALQPLAIHWLEPLVGDAAGWAGVALVALLFGLAHPMSRMYIVVATIGGLYLGALAYLSNELLSAVVAHSLYDVVALVWLNGDDE